MRVARFARPVARSIQPKVAHRAEGAWSAGDAWPRLHSFEQHGFEPDWSEPSFELDWSEHEVPSPAPFALETSAESALPVQANLEVDEPGDSLEQEADRIADEIESASTPFQHAGTRDDSNLPGSLLGRMGQRFGEDLRDVRFHHDPAADLLAESISARAFTTGNDVFFREGQFRPETSEGQHLILHELTHVVQQRQGLRSAEGGARSSAPVAGVVQREPDPAAKRRAICYESAPKSQEPCDPRTPESCHTYEDWLGSFSGLKQFQARDTAPGGKAISNFDVLGVRATRPVDKEKVPEAELAPPAIGPKVSDRFIDHPTDEWVRTCLPANLRETAYRLPSDCADIAVVLRHVWLSAHHRTESFGGWTCGEKAGEPDTEHVGEVIGEVYSGNARSMLNPYSDSRGRPLQSFDALAGRLHPGDVLVWEHHSGGLGTARTGGHVMTITAVTRAGGKVTAIDVLQGNQPIFEAQAEEIRKFVGKTAPSSDVLRDAPGRRIETNVLEAGDGTALNAGSLRDATLPQAKGKPEKKIWTWDDGHTTLVAAGPPVSAPRPAPKAVGKGPAERRIADWLPALSSAGADTLQGTLEAALLELRGDIEGGSSVPDARGVALGTAAGERLFALAKGARDLADESHFRPMVELDAVIRSLGDPRIAKGRGEKRKNNESTPQAAEVARIFALIREAFELAARGGTSISFARGTSLGKDPVKVLVTGFDPFGAEGVPPAPGTINPSAAAALALDGEVIKSGSSVAVVESAVLPVDFAAFKAGVVEKLVRPLLKDHGVDAILTVSLDPNLKTTDPVRLERFVVGVHEGAQTTLETIPASPGGKVGPAIIETPAPLETIAQETEQKAGATQPAIAKPTVGTRVTFRFATSREAREAQQALGLSPQSGSEVAISDVSALRKIVATMQRVGTGAELTFRANGKMFTTTALEGPGGNFLSNEVSFRVLRLLADTGQTDVTSFHTHVPPGATTPIPQGAGKARDAAIGQALTNRAALIATLRRMIGAVATGIVTRRKSQK
jgi:hypothetical protein